LIANEGSNGLGFFYGRFAIQWEWKETAVLAAMDNDNLKEGTADMAFGLGTVSEEESEEKRYMVFSLTEYLPLLTWMV
jgi:hypothetical protein